MGWSPTNASIAVGHRKAMHAAGGTGIYLFRARHSAFALEAAAGNRWVGFHWFDVDGPTMPALMPHSRNGDALAGRLISWSHAIAFFGQERNLNGAFSEIPSRRQFPQFAGYFCYSTIEVAAGVPSPFMFEKWRTDPDH